MVHAQKVEHSVQHQYLDFHFDPVTQESGLLPGTLDRDGQFPEKIVRARLREGKHIRRIVLAEEQAVQASKFTVVREQAVETAPPGHFVAKLFREGSQPDARQPQPDASE